MGGRGIGLAVIIGLVYLSLTPSVGASPITWCDILSGGVPTCSFSYNSIRYQSVWHSTSDPTLAVVTNGTWKDRNDIDMTGWKPAVAVPNNVLDPIAGKEFGGSQAIVPGTAAQLMWAPPPMHAKPTGGNGLPDAYFRLAFLLPADKAAAPYGFDLTAKIIADDRYDLFVNGEKVTFKEGGIATLADHYARDGKTPIPVKVDVSHYLREDNNIPQVIAIHARDGYPAQISQQCPDPKTCDLFDVRHRVYQFLFFDGKMLVNAPEPGTLLVLASGMVGLVCWRRKLAKSAHPGGSRVE